MKLSDRIDAALETRPADLGADDLYDWLTPISDDVVARLRKKAEQVAALQTEIEAVEAEAEADLEVLTALSAAVNGDEK